ncbi:MAG TPA: hypothetical protein VFH73_25305 [Polyangia bacterium]|nr:hypothetical protein [Polyangia bacterium]
MNPITAALLIAFADAASEGTVAPPLPALLARVDQLYAHRDEPSAWSEEQRLVSTVLQQAPSDYDVLWRAARVFFWLSDDPAVAGAERSKWGKQGWDLAERAVTARPNDVAGHYYAAICMGNYALGLGIMKALSMGLEGKFKERLKRAGELDARYDHGSISLAWGGFYDKLPWPKRDRAKAQQHMLHALAINPHSLRARVFLAGSLMNSDRPRDAKTLLDEVAGAPVGRYDAPEERRAKQLGAALMPQLLAKLK